MNRELSADSPPETRRGEEDYQAMRLAVRLASVLAFSVGAVIVFYTMRFAVASRLREFSLLACLGEKRGNIVLSLLAESFFLGFVGTLVGLLAAFPLSMLLIGLGISTTGRVPRVDYAVPWAELSAMAALSVAIALLAAAGPARSLYRMRIVDVLQPRFLTSDIETRTLHIRGFGWLGPPLIAAAYWAVRPFLQSWLTVVQFFVLESLLVGFMAAAVLWWMPPLLRGLIRLFEWALKPVFPLEVLLTGRRLRLTSQKLIFTVFSVTLVFSLLTALHDVTRALKHEIRQWSQDALAPYAFFERNLGTAIDPAALQRVLAAHRLHLFRLSEKIGGEFPIRLVAASDVNRFLLERGQTPLAPGTVIVSRTLAARFDLRSGDTVAIADELETHRFIVIDVTDAVGFFAEDDQYVDLKSYMLFSDGNPLFADNLERTLGDYAAARPRGPGHPGAGAIRALSPFYTATKEGHSLEAWQRAEIDRDFLIFDFILAMTVILAAVGVTNNILIQVRTRDREFAVLRTVGVSRMQTLRLLLVEGAVIGLVAALLSMLLGNTVGAISVAFLDRFTLFDYQFVYSPEDSLLISLLAVATCSLAAVCPAFEAFRISSAESLHYE